MGSKFQKVGKDVVKMNRVTSTIHENRQDREQPRDTPTETKSQEQRREEVLQIGLPWAAQLQNSQETSISVLEERTLLDLKLKLKHWGLQYIQYSDKVNSELRQSEFMAAYQNSYQNYVPTSV